MYFFMEIVSDSVVLWYVIVILETKCAKIIVEFTYLYK